MSTPNPESTQRLETKLEAGKLMQENTLETNQTNSLRQLNPIIFLGIGFLIWFLATLTLRQFGQFIFKADEPLLALGLYLITAFAIIFIAQQLFAWQKLAYSQQFQAVVLLALPGMILDSIIMVSFRTSFPNLVASSDSALASWLLWSYGIVLISGFIQKGDV